MEHLSKNFKDAFGRVWHDDEIASYNRAVDTYNYAVENQPNCIDKAREAVSDVFHAYCGGSIKVFG
jgi:hypothetical protein